MNTAQQQLKIADHLKALAVTNKPIVLVTGATGGIGRAIVEELTGDYAIVAQGRDEVRLLTLSRLGEAIYPVQRDLASPDECGPTFGPLPRVHALLTVAAVAPRFACDDATAAAWSEVMRLSAPLPSALPRTLLPQLQESTGTEVCLGSGASR